jgi:sigma-E factor negative regulatory protein RseB
LEESAFSEIQLDAPVKMENLSRLMRANSDESRGIKVIKTQAQKTTAAAEGWVIKNPVSGFKAMRCYKGLNAGQLREPSMQWVFSDGLASVSIFVESFDRSRHTQEGGARMGATQTWMRRMESYWVTLVGEVPLPTLKAFAVELERKH